MSTLTFIPLFLVALIALLQNEARANTCLRSNQNLLTTTADQFKPCVENPAKLKVATYNILNRNVKKNPNKYPPWEVRRKPIADWVKANKLDIMGTQEGIADMIEDLKTALPQYHIFGRARSESKTTAEFSAIFINKERFDVVNSGDFWLSKTPEIPGSQNWDASAPRLCTWVDLRDKVTGERIVVFNAHYDHLGSMARAKSTKLILEKIKQIAGSSKVLVMGDFNSKADAPELEGFRNNLSESRDSSLFTPTGESRSFFYGVIDHIYATPGMVTCRYQIQKPTSSDGRSLSDHNPVVIEMAP